MTLTFILHILVHQINTDAAPKQPISSDRIATPDHFWLMDYSLADCRIQLNILSASIRDVSHSTPFNT
jgi:hypothetical protein